MEYLAYFQSYTNTFIRGRGSIDGIGSLKRLYTEALGQQGVIGLIIGSRPDCFDDNVIRLLGALNQDYPIFVEIGAESSFDATLRKINRGHDWKTVCRAVGHLKEAGLRTGLHLIMGLPGESPEMMLETVGRSCDLEPDSLKFHHLQIIRDTPLHRLYEDGSLGIKPWEMDEYLEFCARIVNHVPRRIAIERFLASSPPEKVVAPRWGVKNYEFTARLHNLLKERETGRVKETNEKSDE